MCRNRTGKPAMNLNTSDRHGCDEIGTIYQRVCNVLNNAQETEQTSSYTFSSGNENILLPVAAMDNDTESIHSEDQSTNLSTRNAEECGGNISDSDSPSSCSEVGDGYQNQDQTPVNGREKSHVDTECNMEFDESKIQTDHTRSVKYVNL